MVLDRAVGSAASATPTREVAVHPDGDALLCHLNQFDSESPTGSGSAAKGACIYVTVTY
jgi:hypothetical protein